MAEAAPDIVDSDVDDLDELEIGQLLDDDEQQRVREAASQRAESPQAYLRDAILERLADTLGDGGYLECFKEGCEETFSSERRRRGHVGRMHSDNLPEGDFWCGICGYGPSAYSGISAHHGQRHDEEDVRALDHEPDRDELLAPDDIPDHMDRELLEQLYREYDGSITELCRAHDFDVHQGRVRHYLIEYGIHEPTPQGSSENGPKHRNRGFLEEQYERFGGNISEMHRELDLEVSYRGLVNVLKRWEIHDPTDPPGRSHGKGGPGTGTASDDFEASADPEDDASDASPDDESSEDLNTDDEVPDGDQVYVLEWGRWGPPHGGTYHDDPGCRALNRSDSDRDAVPLPWSRQEVEDDEDWSLCGICANRSDDVDESDASDEDLELGPLDVDNVHDLRRAYEQTDSIAEAAEAFTDATYGVVRQYLIDHDIHEPENRSLEEDEPELVSVDDGDEDADSDDGPSATSLDVDFEFESEFQTIDQREEVNPDRVIGDEPFCPGCGSVYQGEGHCESCSKRLEEDLVA